MLELEVEESDDENIKKLFVEVFGDRDLFLEAFEKELCKTDQVEAEMQSRQTRMGRLPSHTAAEEEEEVRGWVGLDQGRRMNLNNDESLENVLNHLDGSSTAETTKIVKIFTKNSKDKASWKVGIAHPRLKKDKTLTTIPVNFTGQETTQQFTKLKSDLWQGRQHTGAAVCTLIPIRSLGDRVQKRLIELFDIVLKKLLEKQVESEESEEEEDGDLRASEDYPQYSQSLNQNTLKNCKFCIFQTRNEEELSGHMEEHPKCDRCEVRLANEDDLEKHIDSSHNHFQCNVCKQKIPITATVDHMKMHNTNEQFNKMISDKTKKTQPPKGSTLFLRTKKALLREVNPNLSHQLATSQVSTMWKELSKSEKKMWNVRAVQEQENEDGQVADAERARLEEVARLEMVAAQEEVARLEEVARVGAVARREEATRRELLEMLERQGTAEEERQGTAEERQHEGE